MGLTVETVYVGDLRTEATHVQSGTQICTDAPVDNHGRGEAFSPTDLVAAALGSCMMTIMGIASQTHGFDIVGTQLKIQKVMGTDPRRIVEIKIDLYFPHDYNAKVRRILELSAKQCPVANSLHPDVNQNIIFHYGEKPE